MMQQQQNVQVQNIQQVNSVPFDSYSNNVMPEMGFNPFDSQEGITLLKEK